MVCGYYHVVNTDTTSSTSLTLEERLRRAQEAYGDYYTQCFWFMPKDLVITEVNLPLVIEGLKLDGGHKGWRLAHLLCR